MRTDYDAHPKGMLNNLLSQLISQILSSFPPLKLTQYHQPNVDPQLSGYCDLFAQLVKALPTDTILFCIIDGISYYEDSSRQAECTEVLSMLTTLTGRSQDATNGPLIKLLTTCPLRSHIMHHFFQPEEIYNMDEHYPSNGGFTALQWDVGVGEVI